MSIRIVYMIIWSMKLVYRANVFATKKHHIQPTLEGGMSIGSFGKPKTFRALQNTTCYVRLNINFQCLEIITHSLHFNSLISPLGNGWSYGLL